MSNQVKISGRKEQETGTTPSEMKELSTIVRVEDNSSHPEIPSFLQNCKRLQSVIGEVKPFECEFSFESMIHADNLEEHRSYCE